MAKVKRNCRLTAEERDIHAKAVKMRKMTDKQLCDYLKCTYESGFKQGEENNAKRAAPCDENGVVTKFISFLEARVGTGNHIGGGTIYRLYKELESAVSEGVIRKG